MYGSNVSSTSSCGESSHVSSASASTHKATLHISPHIAAHKSVPVTSNSNVQSALVDLSSISSSCAVLNPICSTPEIATYRASSNTSNGGSLLQEFHASSSVGKLTASGYLSMAQKDRSTLSLGGMSSSVRTTLTNLARVNPEDLSASSESKMIPATSSSAVGSNDFSINISQQKNSQNLYAVSGEVPAALLPSILGRNNSIFRSADSPNLTGQPQAILVSGLVACGDSSIEHASNPTTLAALPPTSSIVGEVLGLVTEPKIKKEEEVIGPRLTGGAVLQQQQLLPLHQQEALPGHQQQRDMMRQALQAAVDGGGAAARSAEQELIEYSYSAGDIHDLLMLNIPAGVAAPQHAGRAGPPPSLASTTTAAATTTTTSINASNSHNTNSVQLGTAVALTSGSAGSSGVAFSGLNVIDAATGASVIMMPASCGSHSPSDLLSGPHAGGTSGGGLLAASLVNSAGHFISDAGVMMASTAAGGVEGLLPPGTVFSSVGVVDLNAQGAVNVHALANMGSEDGGLINGEARSTISASQGAAAPSKPKKSKNSKLSETDLYLKRMKLAQVMREKRASETEEQKRRRRMREAERMRRRRAMESEEQKAQRRLEAAERARLRRATMNESERLLDRRKAAERMRQRRLNEGEQQKLLRRRRAAESMRKRRAAETPEQRAMRRRTLAIMMKTRRRNKQREGGPSCSASNSLSDDGYRDLTPPPHHHHLEDVKAQDLSSTVEASELLARGSCVQRAEYEDTLYRSDAARGRKLVHLQAAEDCSKLVSDDLASRAASAGVLHRKPTSSCSVLSSCSALVCSPEAPARLQYVDAADRTSALQPRLSYMYPAAASSNSSTSLHSTALCHDSVYSVCGPAGTAGSMPSHVAVVRSTASCHASTLPSSQKSSHSLNNTSPYTPGGLPPVLSSARFQDVESSPSDLSELTAVASCDGARFAVVSSGTGMCGDARAPTTGCSLDTSNSLLNTTRSILRIQNSSSSSPTLNVNNYFSQQGEQSEESPSLRQYEIRSNSSSPGATSPSRCVSSDGLDVSGRRSEAAARCRGEAASTASPDGAHRVPNSSFSPHTASLSPPVAASDVTYITPSSSPASTSHSSVMSSGAGLTTITSPSCLTTIVLNQSIACERSGAS